MPFLICSFSDIISFKINAKDQKMVAGKSWQYIFNLLLTLIDYYDASG